MTEVCIGKRYYFSKSRRTDQFRNKRYTNPECQQWQSIVIMGRAVEQRGGEVKIVVEQCGMAHPDPTDGNTVVMSVGNMLTVPGGDIRTFEDHGHPSGVELGVWRDHDRRKTG